MINGAVTAFLPLVFFARLAAPIGYRQPVFSVVASFFPYLFCGLRPGGTSRRSEKRDDFLLQMKTIINKIDALQFLFSWH
ncbi:hypothetical protein AB6T85_11855 [Erwinia sp. ACCC 02193]|jgi:hypothetical protein|uniref:Uncharacterized protein n=1 Tax=Erwinia aeris TaxID=3239803 RepID=A0ABV4E874_9GAMM